MGALWQSEPSRTEAPEIPPAETPQPKSPRQRRLWWRLIILILLVALVAIGVAAYDEFRTSELQSREFSKLAGTLTYSLQPGPAMPSSTPVMGRSTNAWATAPWVNSCHACSSATTSSANR